MTEASTSCMRMILKKTTTDKDGDVVFAVDDLDDADKNKAYKNDDNDANTDANDKNTDGHKKRLFYHQL